MTSFPIRTTALSASLLAALALGGCSAAQPQQGSEPAVSEGAAEGGQAQGDQGGEPAGQAESSDAADGSSSGGDAAARIADIDGDPIQSCAALMGVDASELRIGLAKGEEDWAGYFTEDGVNTSTIGIEVLPIMNEIMGDGTDAIECSFRENDPANTTEKPDSDLLGYAVLQDGEADRLIADLEAMPGVTAEERDGRTIYTVDEYSDSYAHPLRVSIGDGDVLWAAGEDAWSMAPDL